MFYNLFLSLYYFCFVKNVIFNEVISFYALASIIPTAEENALNRTDLDIDDNVEKDEENEENPGKTNTDSGQKDNVVSISEDNNSSKVAESMEMQMVRFLR